MNDDAVLSDGFCENDIPRIVVNDDVGFDEPQILDGVLVLRIPVFAAKDETKESFKRVIA